MAIIIPHRIRRQRWVVRVEGEDDAFAIRHRLRMEWEDILLPVIESAFEQFDVPDRIIHIPRVELALRITSLEQDVAGLLPQLIRQQLGEQLHLLFNHDGDVYAGAGRRRERTILEDRFDTVLHYLRTGCLPWTAASAGDDAADTAEMLRDVCHRELPRLVQTVLRSSWQGADLVAWLFRLLHLLASDDRPALMHMLLADVPGAAAIQARGMAAMMARSGDDAPARTDALRSVASLLAGSLDHDAMAPASHDADTRLSASSSGPDAAVMPDIHAVLYLLRWVADGADPHMVPGMLQSMPERWRERVSASIADGDPPRRQQHHLLVAGLLAGCFRSPVSSGDRRETVRWMVRLLRGMSREDRSLFVPVLLEDMRGRWDEDVLQIVQAALESGALERLDRDRRLLLAATVLVESLIHTSTASPPELGRAASMVLSPEDRPVLSALRGVVSERAAGLLQMDGGGSAEASAGKGSHHEPVPDTPSTRTPDVPDAGDDAGPAPAGYKVHNRDSNVQHNSRELVMKTAQPPLVSPHDAGASIREGVEGPLVVTNAGLVLLHSFITPLFINAGIIEPGSREIPGPALPRAAALLHVLATGRDDPYEFELGLCKVLLGQGLETPIVLSDGLIRPDDAEEVASLLQAVVTHWSVLKNTSPGALQTSFLQRRGLLRKEERGWRLQVEPASFDLLLNQLPWGISMVRLPWMPELIHVEWGGL